MVWLHLSVFTAYRTKFWWWFAVICCGFGGVWWFAVVCGNLRWFAMVCGGLPFSHTDYIDTANTFGICTLYMYNKTASHANKYANTVQHPMAMKGSTHAHTYIYILLYKKRYLLETLTFVFSVQRYNVHSHTTRYLRYRPLLSQVKSQNACSTGHWQVLKYPTIVTNSVISSGNFCADGVGAATLKTVLSGSDYASLDCSLEPRAIQCHRCAAMVVHEHVCSRGRTSLVNNILPGVNR